MEGRNRKLNRWQGFDYSQSGLYFITICTYKHTDWFGRVENEKMVLNEYGNIVKDCWFDLINHYANCILDEFVIMPDHIHGIIGINEFNRRERSVTVPPDDNRVIKCANVPTIPPADRQEICGDNVIPNNPSDDNRVIKQSPSGDRNGLKPGNGYGFRNGLKPFPTGGHGLSEIVRGFKTFSSKNINILLGESIFHWQKSFHDRVIRNENELNGIRTYIDRNPAQWKSDVNNN